MSQSTVTYIVVFFVPLAVALGLFGFLRERGNRMVVASVVSILAGVMLSFLIAGIALLFSIS